MKNCVNTHFFIVEVQKIHRDFFPVFFREKQRVKIASKKKYLLTLQLHLLVYV